MRAAIEEVDKSRQAGEKGTKNFAHVTSWISIKLNFCRMEYSFLKSRVTDAFRYFACDSRLNILYTLGTRK